LEGEGGDCDDGVRAWPQRGLQRKRRWRTLVPAVAVSKKLCLNKFRSAFSTDAYTYPTPRYPYITRNNLNHHHYLHRLHRPGSMLYIYIYIYTQYKAVLGKSLTGAFTFIMYYLYYYGSDHIESLLYNFWQAKNDL